MKTHYLILWIFVDVENSTIHSLEGQCQAKESQDIHEMRQKQEDYSEGAQLLRSEFNKCYKELKKQKILGTNQIQVDH